MSNHNRCFHGEIKKYLDFLDEKSALFGAMHTKLLKHSFKLPVIIKRRQVTLVNNLFHKPRNAWKLMDLSIELVLYTNMFQNFLL